VRCFEPRRSLTIEVEDGGGAGGTPSRLGLERRARHAVVDADWAGKRFLVTAHVHLLWLAAEIAVTARLLMGPTASPGTSAGTSRRRWRSKRLACASVAAASLLQMEIAAAGVAGSHTAADAASSQARPTTV